DQDARVLLANPLLLHTSPTGAVEVEMATTRWDAGQRLLRLRVGEQEEQSLRADEPLAVREDVPPREALRHVVHRRELPPVGHAEPLHREGRLLAVVRPGGVDVLAVVGDGQSIVGACDHAGQAEPGDGPFGQWIAQRWGSHVAGPGEREDYHKS